LAVRGPFGSGERMILKLLLWAHFIALAAGVGGGLGMSQVGPRLVNAPPDQRERPPARRWA
jgi:hypothetical protein